MKKFRTNLKSNLRCLISEKIRIQKSAKHLQKIVESILLKSEPDIGNVPEKEFDDVERLIVGILTTLRTNHYLKFEKSFVRREVKRMERNQVDKAYKNLELEGRWRDHISAIDAEHGVVIVAEPYGLQAEDFRDFIKLEDAGWRISVDERLATYFPGSAVCVLLHPPKKI